MTPEPTVAPDLLDRFDISSLTAGAARLRPDRLAMISRRNGAEDRIDFAELDRRASALAQAFLDLSAKPGECILVAAGASAPCAIAIIAALRAGLDVALAPLHATAGELGALARDTKAVLLAAEAAYGAASPVDALLSVAAIAPDVRLVCCLGIDDIDGAVPLDPVCMHLDDDIRFDTQGRKARLMTLDPNGLIHAHRQRTLLAAALDLATRARIGSTQTIVSTLAPASFAGLVAGPVLGLLTGAPLALHGPFEAESCSSERSTLTGRCISSRRAPSRWRWKMLACCMADISRRWWR